MYTSTFKVRISGSNKDEEKWRSNTETLSKLRFSKYEKENWHFNHKTQG